MTLWALTSEAAQGEVWRLWTGHIGHYGPAHLLLNAVAAVPPLLIMSGRDRRLVPVWAAIAAPLISCVVLLSFYGSEYRGSSALVLGLWTFAGLRERSSLGTVMLVAAVSKVVVEMMTPLHLSAIDVAPLPIAHCAGAVAGVAWALVVMKGAAEGGGAPQNAGRIAGAPLVPVVNDCGIRSDRANSALLMSC